MSPAFCRSGVRRHTVKLWRILCGGCMIAADGCPERADPGVCWSGQEEALVMRHPSKPLLDKAIAYRAGAIGLGLLPIAMAVAAVFIP